METDELNSTGWVILALGSSLTLLGWLVWLVKAVHVAGPIALADDPRTALGLLIALVGYVAHAKIGDIRAR